MSDSPAVVILAAAVGGGIAILTGVAQELFKDSRKAQQLAHAIAGEVGAALEIVKKRGYVDLLINYRDAAIAGNAQIVKVSIQKTFFPVMEANLQNIGLLPVELPLLCTRFLTLSKAALEDVSCLNTGTWDHLDAPNLARLYNELIEVLEAVAKTGSEIIALVATLYGSPHGRYPIALRVRMLLRGKWL
jgi:hypothetical protein